MAKIVLIGCSKTKLSGTHPARELYTGGLFKKSLAKAVRLEKDSLPNGKRLQWLKNKLSSKKGAK
jgi:hypothetical protein